MSERGGLGEFLRSRRERLTPSAVGLGAGRRRRTPGLRREEVAELAGIGVDWYIRLEQGRSVRPSAATLEALGRALRLNQAEQGHLRALARPVAQGAFVREAVPGAIVRLVQGIGLPAYVTGRRFDVLAWNAAAAEVFTDFGRLAEADRNILVYMLTNPSARLLFAAGWAEEARRMVAQFRVAYDLWAGDAAFEVLVARLRAGCAAFGGWWEAHDIRAAASGEKRLEHPTLGPLRLEHASFLATDDPALKLVIYSPALGGSTAAAE